jgi:uncharacterized protein
LHVSSLHIYPVKSGRAIDLSTSAVLQMGLAHDRQWMIVDARGSFLTQRETPQLARLQTSVDASGQLSLTVENQFHAQVPLPGDDGKKLRVKVWQNSLSAHPASGSISEKLSDWLDQPVTLVHFPDASLRYCDSLWTGDVVPVSFADAFPVLIATRASLDALNQHMATEVPLNRFRPNIVINGTDAWADDHWRRIRIGSVELELVKPCIRCLVTTTDQVTGERMGKEPLATLARLRRSAVAGLDGVLFGSNAVPRRCGDISVGDKVEILETRVPWKLAGTA